MEEKIEKAIDIINKATCGQDGNVIAELEVDEITFIIRALTEAQVRLEILGLKYAKKQLTT